MFSPGGGTGPFGSMNYLDARVHADVGSASKLFGGEALVYI